NPTPPRPQQPSVWRDFRALGIKIGGIAAAFALLFTFLYGLHYDIEPGMHPAVKDGDLVVFYRLDKKYKPGDLLLLTFQGQKQVRRVIATAGDSVDITEEGLVINGALQQEPGISQSTQRYADGTAFPLTLGENQVFVLGDARENAADSRIYGPVDIKDTQGTVITLLRRRNL
ncbi:MAG: signal peptidase I, partial [Clostridiales bacterium]|nr:signal peptidase I [Clostridiales bacterium]